MATHRTLSENNQAARQNVSTLYGYCDRSCHVAATNVVFRPHHDRLAAMNVHRVIRDLAPHFRAVILEDGRRYGGSFTLIDCAGGNRYCGIHNISVSGDAGQRLADAIEFRNRSIKLPAYPCVCTCGINGARHSGRPTVSCWPGFPVIFGSITADTSGAAPPLFQSTAVHGISA